MSCHHKYCESVISICIIAILIIIAGVIFVKQSDVDISRFGITDGKQQPAPETLSKEKFILSEIVPAGFETLSAEEVYTAENLYEKINGKALFYTESGFVKLPCQRFGSKNDANLWMEVFIYDMGSIRNAFSVYSLQRRADANILPIFSQTYGYGTSNGLYFVHGRFYVEVTGSAESDALVMAMLEAAQKIQKSAAVTGEAAIAEVDLFPSENIVPASIKLYLANAFGFEGWTDVFTAQYKDGDQIITVFLSRKPDAKCAEVMAENYRKFLVKNGAKIKQANNEGLKNKVLDLYGMTEIIFTTGTFVCGIHEAENQELAEKLAALLMDKFAVYKDAK